MNLIWLVSFHLCNRIKEFKKKKHQIHNLCNNNPFVYGIYYFYHMIGLRNTWKKSSSKSAYYESEIIK
jgi:hypothetical protein